jgi:hypothetical protein
MHISGGNRKCAFLLWANAWEARQKKFLKKFKNLAVILRDIIKICDKMLITFINLFVNRGLIR